MNSKKSSRSLVERLKSAIFYFAVVTALFAVIVMVAVVFKKQGGFKLHWRRREARKTLKRLHNRLKSGDPDACAAQYMIAKVHEILLEDYSQAALEYQKVLEFDGHNAIRENAVFNQARCLEKTGDVSGALEQYHRVQSEFPGSLRADEARLYIEKLEKEGAV